MLELRDYSDEYLIAQSRTGDLSVTDFLLEKYKPLVRSRAASRYLRGGDLDDLIQEGMIGLYKAIRDYDPENENRASFYTFASVCIDRQLLKAIEASGRQKRKTLDEAVSLTDDEWESYPDSETIPENIVLEKEFADELLKRIYKSLSRMEKVVLDLRIREYDYREIAAILNRTPKQIDNALQRIRKKIGKLMGDAQDTGPDSQDAL
ncbi:MAG: sigma-70 family RNA polymerase sigma factor [Lachnospiraceae bacterium]|nr:sigma-70 family RNA polymerase sigma factor [Lachnospiraceae bacterium]